MHQIFPVAQHQQQPDQKRSGHVDRKRRQRKPPVIFFIDGQRHQVADERPYRTPAHHGKAFDQQLLIVARPVPPCKPPETGRNRDAGRKSRPNQPRSHSIHMALCAAPHGFPSLGFC